MRMSSAKRAGITTTRAMGMALDDIRLPRPWIDPGPAGTTIST
jgi:hypothetical protein